MAKKKKPRTLASGMIKLLREDSGAALIFYSCLADTCGNIQKMSDKELLDTFVFISPQLIRDRFQNMVDILKPLKNNR
ncbi:MAG: hypothetical protein LBL58_13845 [Tannerellaceae bacterium]|jgi:hypothetical protein|nr:hypothetical protein [Tannerellaceae bacterium]